MDRSYLFNQSRIDGESFIEQVFTEHRLRDRQLHCSLRYCGEQSGDDSAELPDTCAETQNEEPGDPDLFCPHSHWAVSERVGKNWVRLSLTGSSPVRCCLERGCD